MYPTALRRALVVLGALLVGLIVVCWHRRGGTGPDHWVAARLTPVRHSSLLAWFRQATDPWYVLGASWVLAVRHEMRGRRRRALSLVVPVLAALAVTELVLKPGVDARATSGAWTFPSGNATGGVAFVVAVYWVELRHRWKAAWRVASVGVVAVVVAVSCFALVADRTHFLTDVLGGLCVGGGVPLAVLGAERLRRPEVRVH